MDQPQSSEHDNNQSGQQYNQLVIVLAAILLAGLLLSGVYLALVADRLANQQTRSQGELLSQQTATLIKPALLAADPVSLNFVLNQLVQQDHIDAIKLTDTKDRLLGRAGEATNDDLLTLQANINQQDQPLAFLELSLNPTYYRTPYYELLIQALILSLIVIIIALSTLWHYLRSSPPTRSESSTFATAESLPEKTERTPSNEEAQKTPDETENILETTPFSTTQSNIENSEGLVDLLRPAEDAPTMPGFAPFTEHKESAMRNQLQTAPEAKPIVEEINLSPLQKEKSKFKNPLFENDKKEVQLDLYSFEQELELIVAADNAGYLLYLDLASGHSDNISQKQLHEMQEFYYRMLDMVIAIYQGEAATVSNGDLQLAFLKPHKDDSHGVNAICASQLFNRLYKLFNQQRIRNMQPVLNLHMALVRGHYKKLPRLQEEARYLTHSTESNELITHTALSEAPDLKVSLLAGAEIQRAEEDKVLILSVNENYQKLLDKQAQHLLGKLFP